jgi:hypothetical protein
MLYLQSLKQTIIYIKNNPPTIQVQIETINAEANKDQSKYISMALLWLWNTYGFANFLLPPPFNIPGVVCSITISAAYLVAAYRVYDNKIEKLSQIGGEVTSEITLEQLKEEIQNSEK